MLVSVHSCTPVYLGVSRPWHVGVLYEHDTRLAHIVLELLKSENGLVVGDNQPYFMTEQKDFSVPVHGEGRGLAHVELEIRQDLVETGRGQREWAERMAGVLAEALERLGQSGTSLTGR